MKDYIKLIEDGVIRIIGREKWLLERHTRNSHRWEGARWDRYVDDAIYRIYIWDLYETDVRKKRVIVADDEPGQEWAESIVGSDPTQVSYWQSVLESEDVAEQIPPGTLQAIQEQELTPEAAAIRILRDARNHGQAVQDSRAETPFLLSPADAKFLKTLSEMRRSDPQEGEGTNTPDAEADHQRLASIADILASQLVDILERLDECLPGKTSLMRFFQRGGHDELVAWLVDLKEAFAKSSGRPFKEALFDALFRQLKRSKRDGVRTLFDSASGTLLAGMGAMGAVNTVSQAAQDANLQNLLGLAIETLLLGYGGLRILGFVEGSYSGPQWPYLYTYGKKANRRRRNELLDNLRARPLPNS